MVQSIGLKDSDVWKQLSSLAQDLHRNPEFEQAKREYVVLNTLIGHCDNGCLKATSEQLQEFLSLPGVKIDSLELGDLLKQCGGQQANARLPMFNSPRRCWMVDTAGLQKEAERLQTEWNFPLSSENADYTDYKEAEAPIDAIE